MERQCKKCQEIKPYTLFKKNNRRNDGIDGVCLRCAGKCAIAHRIRNPWMGSFSHAKSRCQNPHDNKYERYGKRGIKFLLTKDEIKSIWFRDKAFEMGYPTIDRIDSDGNYQIDNCRFIEKALNTSLMRKLYSKKTAQLKERPL